MCSTIYWLTYVPREIVSPNIWKLSCNLNLGIIAFYKFQNDTWLKRIETHTMEMMKLDMFLVDIVGDGTWLQTYTKCVS